MAGDWIKIECSTPDKPEVLAITVKMGWDDPDLTVGKLFKLWRWFDQQTTDGNALSVTSALLDRYLGVSGFVTAVASVGWLSINEDGVSLVDFDKHNGTSAKQRSQTAKRVANHKSNAKGNAHTVTKNVSSALPREEKRREDIKEANASLTRASKKCPASFEVTDNLIEWAAESCPLVNTDNETHKLRDYTFSRAITDWPGAWRNWMRKAQDDAAKRSPNAETPYQRSMRERYQVAAPSIAASNPGASRIDPNAFFDLLPAKKLEITHD